MCDRLSNSLNDYQHILYPYIQKECKDVGDKYNVLVNSVTPIEYHDMGFYLNGSKITAYVKQH
jgi:hypothetical protein